jgi:hypothetical protein
MHGLEQSLQKQDIGHLRIVAGLWGLELASAEYDAVLQEITAALLDPRNAREMFDSLSASARAALEGLLAAGGRMPWAAFTRQYGGIREAGPGRRDREQVYLHPASAAEVLFYRAMLARAFFDTPGGAQEFAYIPEDLEEILKDTRHQGSQRGSTEVTASEPLGRAAMPKEYQHILPASDHILDDATTCLAALRMGMEPQGLLIPLRVVMELLQAAGIVTGETADPEKVKAFLEMPRLQALTQLTDAWQASDTFNELRQVPDLVCEGEWTNQPLTTRQFLFRLLEAVPEAKWWSLLAFVRAIKGKHPDFQRPAGDYDSWFIKRLADGTYLRGFEHWDDVDGALLRYIITGPMFWLGVVELATPEEEEFVTAFRVNERPISSQEKGKVSVTSNGLISVPVSAPRAARYLISRFCDWEPARPEEYRYRVTTMSLKRAREQGLKVGQLLSLLAKNASAGIPPAFVKALKRWELNGTEAHIEVQTVLRVSRPEVLEELRKSRAGRFLGETLGPVTVIVRPGAQAKVLAALAELGLLAEIASPA